MTVQEKSQMAYLRKRKDAIIDQFIGACSEINLQMAEVKSGAWSAKMAKEDNKNVD